MKIAIGIDVHKEKSVAWAVSAGIGEPKPRHQEFLDRINKDFRRFPSDIRGYTELADALKGHEVHILIEGSTKSHDVYWMVRNLGLDIIAAHAADLRHIADSTTKNDDNDAKKLAGYMRRRLWGEVEFAVCHIPEPETLLQREMCRYDLRLREELTSLKLQIRSHMLIRGWKLTREYPDITSAKAMRELEAAPIEIFRFDVAKAKYLKNLIFESERTIRYQMRDNRYFEIIWSIPGFGVLSAGYMACMIEDLSRFDSDRSFAASFGLTPKLDESADKPKNCGISRRGDPEARRLISQATFVHIFNAESFITEKYRRLKSRGKSHNEALTACSNSMARMIYTMLRNDTKYCSEPELLAKTRSLADSDDIDIRMEDVQVDA